MFSKEDKTTSEGGGETSPEQDEIIDNHIDLVQKKYFDVDVKIFQDVKIFLENYNIFYFEVEILSRGSISFGFKDLPSSDNGSIYQKNSWDLSKRPSGNPKAAKLTSTIYGVGVMRFSKGYAFFCSKNGTVVERTIRRENISAIYPFIQVLTYGGIVYVNMGDKPTILDFQNNLPTISPNRMVAYGQHAPMVSFDGKFCSFHDESNLSVSIGRYPINIHFPINTTEENPHTNDPKNTKNVSGLVDLLDVWHSKINKFLQIGRYVGYEFSIELCQVPSKSEIVFGFTSELPTDTQDDSEVIDDIRRLFCVSLSEKGMVSCRKINRAFKIARPDITTQWEYEKRLEKGLRLFASISTGLDSVTFWFQSPSGNFSRTIRIETRPTDWHMETMYPFVSVLGNGVLCHVTFDDIQDTTKGSVIGVTEEVEVPQNVSIGSNLHLYHFLSRDRFSAKATKK